MLDLTFGFDWSYEMYPEDASYDSKKALVAVNATKTSNFVSKVEKSVARESETLPTSRPGVDACSTSLCKLRRNGKKQKGGDNIKSLEDKMELNISAKLFMDNMDDWNNKLWIVNRRHNNELTSLGKFNDPWKCYEFVKDKVLLSFSFFNNQYKVVETEPSTRDIVILCVE